LPSENGFAEVYFYDAVGRLNSVGSSHFQDSLWSSCLAYDLGYRYHPNTDRVADVYGADDCQTFIPPVSRKTAYEPLRDLVTEVSNFWDRVRVSSHVYKNDALGRRIARDDSHGQPEEMFLFANSNFGL